MSRHFGKLIRKLRLEKGLSLAKAAEQIGTFKGYVCGIEKGRVRPPSVRFIKKYAKFYGSDLRELILLAWVDKAPAMIRKDAERFLEWCQREQTDHQEDALSP